MHNEKPPPLVIRLFGPMEVWVENKPMRPLRTRKGLWLLALLALRSGRPVQREWLAATLWPDSVESQALANLREKLSDLRSALGSESYRLVSPTTQTLALDLSGADADILAFDALVLQGTSQNVAPEALQSAVALYRGPLLEGCLEEWVYQERESRLQAYLLALERLAEEAGNQNDPAAAIRWLRMAIQLDPYRESAHAALMQRLAQSGDYAAATQVYRDLRLTLHDALNLAPSAETTELYKRLRSMARQQKDPPVPSSERQALSVSDQVSLPSGIVTFLFTDIEGSAKLWEERPEAMKQALARHDILMHDMALANNGVVFKTVGDSSYLVFATASSALAAALEIQQSMRSESWLSDCILKVRIALHTGEAEQRDNDYFGPTLNRIARLLSIGHGGQTLLSSVTQELVRDSLPRHAALLHRGEHRLKDLFRPESVYELTSPSLKSDFPPLLSLDNPEMPNNLPVQLTSFIGREREIAEVKTLLANTRLLTQTGSGGCGKTRLALQVAADILEDYHDGAWFVELAPLSDPNLVIQTVANVFGVRETAGQSLLQNLIDNLKTKRLLLVLDNCEHLLAGCAYLSATLIRSCPLVHILATSREPMGVPGEQTFRVSSLSVPSSGSPVPVDKLAQYEAVQLFIARALLVNPNFVVTNGNAPAIASVCYQLDGIPLALELAAARVRSLSIEEIEARLGQRFRFLTGGDRSALPRQRTLQAAVDWSYELLSEQERLLLQRLSVFAGGWTLAAGEAVCSGEGIEDWEMLDLLTSLVDKSLVLYEEREGHGRYHLLETVRQYAAERIEASGAIQATQDRHVAYLLEIAEEAYTKRFSAEGPALTTKLEREHDNFRVGLDFCEAYKEASTHLRLAGALQKFWEWRGHFREGRTRLEIALTRPDGLDHSAARARALLGAANLAALQNDPQQARVLYEQSAEIWRELGEKRSLAIVLNNLGVTERQELHYATSQAYFEESLTLMRERNDPAGVALLLNNIGALARMQNSLINARAFLEESVVLSRSTGNVYVLEEALRDLALTALQQGDYEAAYRYFREVLTLMEISRNEENLIVVPEALAEIAVMRERSHAAVRLFAGAAAVRNRVGIPVRPYERTEYNHREQALRAKLDEENFTAEWTKGLMLKSEEILALAQDILS